MYLSVGVLMILVIFSISWTRIGERVTILAAEATKSSRCKSDAKRVSAGQVKDEPSTPQVELALIRLKGLLTFYQILSQLPSAVPRLKFPAAFLPILQAASIANLGFIDLAPIRCLMRGTAQEYYAQTLVGRTAGPLAVVLLILILLVSRAGYLYRTQWRLSMDKLAFGVGTMLFVVHCSLPSATIAAFHAFACSSYDFGNGVHRRFMRAEPTIKCSSRLYNQFILPFAGLMVAIWPIAVPSFYLCLLCRAASIAFSKLGRIRLWRSSDKSFTGIAIATSSTPAPIKGASEIPVPTLAKA